MGDHFRAPFDQWWTNIAIIYDGFWEGLQFWPSDAERNIHTENISQILIIQTKFGLWLSFSDRFITNRNSNWCWIYRKRVITIQIWFGLARFRKDFSVCINSTLTMQILGRKHSKEVFLFVFYFLSILNARKCFCSIENERKCLSNSHLLNWDARRFIHLDLPQFKNVIANSYFFW